MTETKAAYDENSPEPEATRSIASHSPRVLIVVATYNEIENLPKLIESIFAAIPECQVLVVDDGSPDGTGKWADERASVEPRMQVVHRAGKLGLGSATILAMRYGIDRQFDIVVTLDADFSHPPDRIPDLLQTLSAGEGCEVAIGSRYAPGGEIVGWPRHRRWISRAVNAYARLTLGLPVRDCSGAFRAYRVPTLAKLPPESIKAAGYAYLEEILFRLKKAGARMKEVPYRFRDREAGQTKIDAREAVSALVTMARLGCRRWSK